MKKSLGYFIVAASFFAEVGVFADGSIPMFLSPDPQLGPFYAITITGTALTGPMPIPFDTEGRVIVVPDGCLSHNVTVIDANTKDEWGNPAELVMGNITIQSGDNSVQYTANVPFYADKGQNCKTGFSNFGANMNPYNDAAGKNGGPDYRYVGNFFSYYDFPSGVTPGYTINAYKTVTPTLLIGTVTQSPFSYTLPNHTTVLGVGGRQIPACTGVDNYDTTVPGFNITIDSVVIPNYEIQPDTGGGMMIIRDDAAGTYTAALAGLNKLGPCPKDLHFLVRCQCIAQGQSVQVSKNAGPKSGFGYNYITTDPSTTQQFAAAICPNTAFGMNSPTPTILQGAVNPGYAFYNLMQSVSYNVNTCTIYMNI